MLLPLMVQLTQADAAAVDEGGGEGLGIGSPDHQGDILQQVAHADSSDQNGKGGRLAERAVGKPLDGDAQAGAEQHGDNKGQHRGQAPVLQAAEGDIGADHDDVAMGEVQHPGDAVDHGVAEGDDRVDAAQAETVDQIIKKNHKNS